MGTLIGTGFSKNIDSALAAQEAIESARRQLKGNSANLVVIFSSIHHQPESLIHTAFTTFEGAKIVGCSTAGIISATEIFTHGVGILAISSDEIKIGAGSVTGINDANLKLAGSELGRNMISDFGQHSRSVCLFLIDGNIADSSPILRGVQEILGNVFPIVGAGSCDDFHNANTYQICDAQALEMSACGFILGGGVSVGISGRHGWRPLGKPRIVTKTKGNIIETIDHKQASNLYEEYFDHDYHEMKTTQLGRMSILYPLGIFIEENNEFLLRNVVDILDDGSIVCQGDVPEGAEVHIMIGNKESCKQAAFDAAIEAQKNLLGKKARLVIVIESMARLKLLGRGAINEITRIHQVFGENTPIFGMYANGEICPFESVDKIKKPYLQNESIVVLAIA